MLSAAEPPIWSSGVWFYLEQDFAVERRLAQNFSLCPECAREVCHHSGV